MVNPKGHQLLVGYDLCMVSTWLQKSIDLRAHIWQKGGKKEKGERVIHQDKGK